MPYDSAVIRQLIDASFGSEDFDFFCHDHFNVVYDKFTNGQSKPQRIQFLIEHAEKNGLTEQLPTKVKDANPYQYKQFESRLKKDKTEGSHILKIQTAKLPVTGEDLFGREKEPAQLKTAWEDPNTGILTLVAFGGVGKTSLVNHWLLKMRQNEYGGAERVYGWSFYSFLNIGRLRESVQLTHAALELHKKQKNWKGLSHDTYNLSELQLLLGDVAKAVDYGRQSVEFADRSGNVFEKEAMRTILALALHQQNDLAEAERLFQEAEIIQKERRPDFFYLNSEQGYRYCDLLLSRKRYEEVRDRANKALEIAIKYEWILEYALDNLSIGRVLLFKVVTEKTIDFTEAEHYLNQSVEGLRSAGQQQYLPLGLLARAELYRIKHEFPKAHTELTEVRELAERSEMRLHLTDYHLESARLILAETGVNGDEMPQKELKTHIREAEQCHHRGAFRSFRKYGKIGRTE